jgi:hypothetical protein
MKSYSFFFLFISLILFASCLDQSEPIPFEVDSLLIQDAKSYFDTEILNTNSLNKSPNSRRRTFSLPNVKALDWENAKINVFGEDKVIIVPVDYENDIYLKNGSQMRSLDLHTFVKMQRIKENSDFEVELLTFVFDEDYLANGSTNYSGLLFKETWSGEFIGAYQTTENGFQKVNLVEGAVDSRTNCGSDSYFVEYYECQFVTVENQVIGKSCRLMRTSYVCVEPATLAPGDFDMGGGGGGPSGGSEPPPVTCDELRGYIVDENGDCIKMVEDETITAADIDVDLGEQYTMNECERQLVNEHYQAALVLKANSIVAHNRTRELFGDYVNGNGHNDCADAFRHIYFNFINARNIGGDLTREFGEAHECDTPNDLLVERDMDLHNNEIGIRLAAETSRFTPDQTIVDMILAEISSGNALILNPVAPNNGVIPGVTQTVSSNGCF